MKNSFHEISLRLYSWTNGNHFWTTFFYLTALSLWYISKTHTSSPYFAVIDRRTVLKIVIDSWTAPFHNQSLLTLYFIPVITSDSIFTFISINHRSTGSWSDSTFSAFSLQSMCHAWRIRVLFPISCFQLSNTADSENRLITCFQESHTRASPNKANKRGIQSWSNSKQYTWEVGRARQAMWSCVIISPL